MIPEQQRVLKAAYAWRHALVAVGANVSEAEDALIHAIDQLSMENSDAAEKLFDQGEPKESGDELLVSWRDDLLTGKRTFRVCNSGNPDNDAKIAARLTDYYELMGYRCGIWRNRHSTIIDYRLFWYELEEENLVPRGTAEKMAPGITQ